MKLNTVRQGLILAAAASAVLWSCSSNSTESLRFKTGAEVPVTNKRFILAEELDNLWDIDSNDMAIRGIGDTTKGDTVAFEAKSKDTSKWETTEDTIEDKVFDDVLGPIPLTNAAKVTYTLPYPPGVAGNRTVDTTVRMPLTRIYFIRFHTSSAPCTLSVVNRSAAVQITNLRIGLAGVDSSSAPGVNLAANQSARIPLRVAGRSVDTVGRVWISAAIASTASVAAGDGLAMEFSLAGAKADSLRVIDSLVSFTKDFKNDYELTDTVAISYIDILQGYFLYTMSNQTGVPMQVVGHHRHMWRTAYCILNNVLDTTDLTKISTPADSLRAYSGTLTAGDTKQAQVTIGSGVVTGFNKATLDGSRLFTYWDPAKRQTVTSVTYRVSTQPPRGQPLSLSSRGRIVFTITSLEFKFKEFSGVVMDAIHRTSDTQHIEIPWVWDVSAKDSLRNKFFLKSVAAKIKLTPGLPQDAMLDTMKLRFSIFDPKHPDTVCTLSTSLTGVKDKKVYDRGLGIERVVNLFPDSVYASVKLDIPVGTKVRVVNDLLSPRRQDGTLDPDYGRYIGRMTIKAFVDYKMGPLLWWWVRDVATMDLGSGEFRIGDDFRILRKIDEKVAQFRMSVRNNTNVFVRLYALVAPDTVLGGPNGRTRVKNPVFPRFDSLNTNEVTALLSQSDQTLAGQGYMSLLGSDGVLIPKRDVSTIVKDTVKLTEEQIDLIASANRGKWRWQLRFMQMPEDALIDTDYIEIHSSFMFEGVTSVDSMVVW